MTSNYEAVCVCGHPEEDHVPECSRCENPVCRFFVLRFHREIIRLTQWEGPDPVGRYYQLYPPARGSAAWVFAHLSEADRAEIASPCFQNAQFTSDGTLMCTHTTQRLTLSGLPWCEEEYACEVIAAELLMPSWAFYADSWLAVEALEVLYQVPDWAVRFKLALLGMADAT